MTTNEQPDELDRILELIVLRMSGTKSFWSSDGSPQQTSVIEIIGKDEAKTALQAYIAQHTKEAVEAAEVRGMIKGVELGANEIQSIIAEGITGILKSTEGQGTQIANEARKHFAFPQATTKREEK